MFTRLQILEKSYLRENGFQVSNHEKGLNCHSRDIVSKDKWVQLKGRMTASHAKTLTEDDLFANHHPRVRPLQRSHPVPFTLEHPIPLDFSGFLLIQLPQSRTPAFPYPILSLIPFEIK